MAVYQYAESEDRNEKNGLDRIHRQRVISIRETKGPEALSQDEIFIH